jgi:hypothetical protein
MTTKNAQTLDGVPSDADSYHLMVGGGSLSAVGKVLLDKGGAELPRNIVFCGDTPQWSQSRQTIAIGDNKIQPSQFTGFNVRADGSAMVTADGTPSLSDDGWSPDGSWDDPSVPTGTATYGAQTPGSIWAERATLSDQGFETPGLPRDHLVVYRHTKEFTIPNEIVGKPHEDEFHANEIYNFMPSVVHNWSSTEANNSVTFGGHANSQIINKEGQLACNLTLLPDANGNQPKLTIEGMLRVDPSTTWLPGPPGGSAQSDNETYEYEDKICKDRAEKAEVAEQARFDACLGDDCSKFDGAGAYDDCLTSCRDGTAISKSWRSDCFDSNYEAMGGRLPDQWHIGAGVGSCGCGNKGYNGCNYEIIVNIV